MSTEAGSQRRLLSEFKIPSPGIRWNKYRRNDNRRTILVFLKWEADDRPMEQYVQYWRQPEERSYRSSASR